MTRGPSEPQERVVFKGAGVVTPDGIVHADMTVEDGLILAIGKGGRGRTIDCGGCFILPGFVDLHSDNIEHHIEPRPGIFWPTAKAVLAHDAELAGAGITTAYDAITLGGGFVENRRQEFAMRAIESLDAAAGEGLLRIDHRLHLRCELSDPALPTLIACLEGGPPQLVSLMDHTPGRGQWRDIDRFRTHYTRRYGLSDAELEALVLKRRSSEPVLAANRRHAIALATAAGAVLASHDDAEIADVAEALATGCTICEFPTTEAAAASAAEAGLAVVGGAPNLVRGRSHSGNVAAGELARNGHLHILSSDYCPSSLVQGVFMLRDIYGWTLARASEAASLTPARVMGLDDRGMLAPGCRADFIVVRETRLGPLIRETWARGVRVF